MAKTDLYNFLQHQGLRIPAQVVDVHLWLHRQPHNGANLILQRLHLGLCSHILNQIPLPALD